MVLPSLLVLLSACGGSMAAAVARSTTPRARDGTCTTILQRRAWHTFTDEEKRAYIDAELCLMAKPATLGLKGTKNRFEELQWTHQHQSNIVHNVGAFLPYHRLLMWAHEKLLREECGYQGAQPYWDEARDAGKFSTSDVLDPVTGFGGNGVGERGCIVDGPFVNFTNSLGPGYRIGEDHCIYRFVNDNISRQAARSFIDECYRHTTFARFWPCAEGSPHSGGHGGVGGKMLDPISSPGDPVFYLHHTWLDKVWWDWQALDLPARLTDISGRNTPGGGGFGGFPGGGNGTNPGFPWGNGTFPGGPGGGNPWRNVPFQDMVPPADAPGPEGDPGNVTTLTHILKMYGVVPDATIADVMDVRGSLLCYEYVDA
ncbi:hypothetical protein VTJ49DRAFT_5309 [Mycothermus thermophilus]|uniref:Tyrosinase copper-binding domain-containing protein n=1 Tax=Humicola insolens TaxID=85995 RepID=A0ABR3V3I7_HUMIN